MRLPQGDSMEPAVADKIDPWKDLPWFGQRALNFSMFRNFS